MVTHGWQRVAFRELDARLSTAWQPVHTFQRAEPLQPGAIVPVDVELRPNARDSALAIASGSKSAARGSIRAIHLPANSPLDIARVRRVDLLFILVVSTMLTCISASG
jgi:hypothetical protein